MLKWLGAVLIIGGCGGFGFLLAASHRRTEQCLRRLIAALDYMECELQYHLTPLPALCRQAAAESSGMIRELFCALAQELEDQVSPDVKSCMQAAIGRIRELPRQVADALRELGSSLGRFDLQGQLQGLEAVRATCRRSLEELSANREVRLRSYQTLGLCAGAALAILFL